MELKARAALATKAQAIEVEAQAFATECGESVLATSDGAKVKIKRGDNVLYVAVESDDRFALKREQASVMSAGNFEAVSEEDMETAVVKFIAGKA